MATRRIDTFDVLKGIGILLMIIGHSTGKIPYLRDFIFSFHMPLFFLITGYFFKPAPWKELLSKNAKRLLVPYLFTATLILIHMLLYAWHEGRDVGNVLLIRLRAMALGSGAPKVFGMGPAIGALWFLCAMFWSYLFLNLALRTRYPFLFCMGLAALSFALHKEVFLPLSLQPGFSGTLFLYVGYQIRQHRLLEYIPRWPKRFGKKSLLAAELTATKSPEATKSELPEAEETLPGITSFRKHQLGWIVLLFALWFTCFHRGKLEMSCDYYRLWYFDMIGAVAGCWFMYLLARLIARSGTSLTRVLRFFGRYSLVVLCFHQYEASNIPWHYLALPAWGDYRLPLLWLLKILFAFLMVQLVLHIPFLRKVFQIK